MKVNPASLFLALTLSLVGPAVATTYTWDASGGAPLDDGPGAWNASGGANWTTDGASFGAWGNTTDDEAVFGVNNGAAGTVNVGTVNANSITFNAPGSGTYTLTGGTITLGGTTPTITTNANAAIGSVVAGSGVSLTKSGGATLTLTGANTYSGTTSVNQGTLIVAPTVNVAANGTVTQSSSSYSVTNGATLRLDGSAVTGGAGFVIWDINPVSISAGSTLELFTTSTSHNNVGSNAILLYWGGSDQISGAGALNKEGAGVMVINGNGTLNNFTGTLNVNGGTFGFQGPSTSTIGNFAVSVASGATLDFRTDAQKVGTISGNGSIIKSFNGAGGTITIGCDNGNGTFSGTIASSVNSLAPIDKTGTGRQVFAGSGIAYTGNTTLTNGTLALSNTTAFNSNVAMSASNTVTLELNAPGAGDSWTFSKQITGGSANATIEKTGSGTVTLTPAASSSFSGSGKIAVTGGRLYLNNANFTTAPAVTVADGATFGGTGTAGAISVAHGGTLQGGAGAAGTLTAGNATLGSSSSDQTTLKGILSATEGYKAIAVNNLTINGGDQSVTLDATGTGLTSGTYYDLLVSANAITAPNATSVLAALKSNARAYTPNVDGNKIQLYYDANATVTWTGANGSAWDTATQNWKLTGNDAPTTFLANDVVYFGDNPTNTTVDISSGNVSPLAINFTNGPGTSYTVQGSNGIAAGSVNKTGGGLVTILNSNSFTGGTTMSAGTLAFANGALGSGTVAFSGDSTLQWTSGNTQAVPVAIASGVTATLDTNGNSASLASTTGAGSISKGGAGTLTLGASAGHTGATAANNGTLVIAPTSAGSLTQATSGYAAADGATLRFDGSNIGGSFATWNIKPVSISAGATVEITDSGATHTGPTTNSVILTNGTQFSGAGALNKEGNGSIVINATGGLDGFTGTLNVNQGTLSFQGGATSAVGNFTVSVATGATLDFRTDGQKVGALNGTGTIIRSFSGFGGTLTIGLDNRDGSFSGTIAASLDANMPLVKDGSGTQTFSGSNIAYVAPTTVTDGRLKLSDTTAFNSNVTVNATGTLELNRSAGTWNLGKTLAGSGAIEKTGDGAVTLTANSSTFGGATTVSAGALFVTGQLGGDVSVSTGLVGGTGTIAGDLGIGTGGKLDVTGGNLLDGTGLLTLGGALTLTDFGFGDIVGWDGASAENGTYLLMNGVTAITFAGTTPTQAAPYDFGGGKQGYFEQGSLRAVIIPEPSAFLLVGLGAASLAFRRRRN